MYFPGKKSVFFKQDFIGQNKRLRDPFTNYVICCGFPKSSTLLDRMYNSDRAGCMLWSKEGLVDGRASSRTLRILLYCRLVSVSKFFGSISANDKFLEKELVLVLTKIETLKNDNFRTAGWE